MALLKIKMRKIEKLLFSILVPIALILLFISSGEEIIPILKNTKLEMLLVNLSFPNSIIFNLCIGYLSGIFIYYLTTFIPEKKRIKHQKIITHRLLSQVNNRIESIFRTIQKFSTKKNIDFDNLKEEELKELCVNTLLDIPIGSKTVVSENPLILRDTLLREKLVIDWSFIKSHLDEIDNASIYIEPEVYNLCLKIKKSPLAYTHKALIKDNVNLEAWSSSLFPLYELNEELKQKLIELE